MGRDFVAVFSDTILDNYLQWWIPEPPNKSSVENGHDFRHFLCIKGINMTLSFISGNSK